MTDAPSAHPDRNRRMFDRIARRYDRMNALCSLGLHHRWRRAAARALAMAPGQRILDIGAGGADMAIELARQCPAATIVGVDPSQEMLAVGRKKLTAADLAGVELIQGDATDLTIPDESFHRAIAAFSFRNIADRPKALAEIHRILAPGGKLVILELTSPTNPICRLGHRIHLATIVPILARWASPDPEAYRYLAESIQAFPPAAEVLDQLTAAGFRDAQATPLTGGVVTIFSAHKANA